MVSSGGRGLRPDRSRRAAGFLVLAGGVAERVADSLDGGEPLPAPDAPVLQAGPADSDVLGGEGNLGERMRGTSAVRSMTSMKTKEHLELEKHYRDLQERVGRTEQLMKSLDQLFASRTILEGQLSPTVHVEVKLSWWPIKRKEMNLLIRQLQGLRDTL